MALLLTKEASANIQSIPTTWIYVTGASSYDAVTRDIVGHQLNGQNGHNPAHLGARFAGVYVDRVNAFGLLAWDDTIGYLNGAALNKLNLGNGEWPNVAPTNTPYFDRDNYLPQIVFDNLTNYTGGNILAGSDSCYTCTNMDQGPTTLWNGPFVEGLIGFIGTVGTATGATNSGTGIVTTGPGLTNAAYASICTAALYYTLDGSTPTTNSLSIFLSPGCGPSTISVPDPTFNFNGFIYGSIFHGPVVNLTLCSLGTCWSNQVVVNGGANPSRASVTNINNFWQGILADWGSGPPNVYSLNLMATDSLTAAITPQIWQQVPNQALLQGIYTNHNFVAGDLTVNGLTGNASTKYLDTGVNISTLPVTMLSLSWYAYNTTASGSDWGGYDGVTKGFEHIADYTDTKSYSLLGANANLITVATSGNGFYSGERLGAANHRLFFANSGTGWAQIGATDSTVLGGSYSSLNLYVFCDNANGSTAHFTSDTLSTTAIVALTSSGQGQSLFNRVQAWRVANQGGFR